MNLRFPITKSVDLRTRNLKSKIFKSKINKVFFKDVIGHEEIKQRLITSLQTGRISHAQLFSGDTGAGSLALALAFTQYLFCTGDKHEDACGGLSGVQEDAETDSPGFTFCLSRGEISQNKNTDQ